MSLMQKPVADTRAHDPLNRREPGGQLRGFRPEFNVRKLEIMRPLMAELRETRRLKPDSLMRPALAELDERAVEYPVALVELIKAAANPFLHVLDVGCVLNNPIISDYVAELAEMIWLVNPSLEKPAYSENMVYVLSDIRRVRLPPNLKFDLVTSLSTVEHVGMDNTRYGGAPAEFKGLIDDPERYAVDAVRAIARFVAPGGILLVSVPYGPFEYLYVYGEPDRPIYYTFDKPRGEALAGCLQGFDVETFVYKVIPGQGWTQTSLDDDQNILRHADRCAAAGGVLFIRAVRHG